MVSMISGLVTGYLTKEKAIKKASKEGGDYLSLVKDVDFYSALLKKSILEIRIWAVIRVIVLFAFFGSLMLFLLFSSAEPMDEFDHGSSTVIMVLTVVFLISTVLMWGAATIIKKKIYAIDRKLSKVEDFLKKY